MKSQTIVTVVVLLLLVGATFGILYIAGSGLVPTVAGGLVEAPVQSSELTDNRAPYFDIPNMSGDHVKLSDFTGPLVLVFWSTWNTQAADQMKILDDYLAEESSQHVVDVLAVDSQEEPSIVASFIRRGGYQVPVILDTFGSVSGQYSIKALPTFVFIDKTGTVREVYAGILSSKDIGDKVENILK